MNANQLFYFATVGKYSNITKAAAELHISQPAITKSIQQLEEELASSCSTAGRTGSP